MSDLLSVASPRTGELLAGRYRLIERVGTGGMARVYRARDELLARDVAVKLFPADGAQHSADTLRRAAEANVLAALSHPSLVTLYDAHVESGETAFLVMEFVDGPTLRDRMDAGDLDGDQIRAVLSELAAALATVHAGGVVHRDVKPSNVLLRPTPDGTATQTVLADFGVAHFIDAARLTSPGTVIGTAAYLAPEQVRGEPPLPASDVYALGLVVLEALTGRHPFGNHSVQATILARLARQPDMPPALAADWAALLTAMTAHEPAARPTAAEVAARAAALGNPGEPAALRAEQATAAYAVSQTQPLPPVPTAAAAAPVPTAAMPAHAASARTRRRGVVWSAGALVALTGAALIVALALATPGAGREAPVSPTDEETVAVEAPVDPTPPPAEEVAPVVQDRGPDTEQPADNPNKGPGNNSGSGNGNSGNGNGNSGNGNSGNGGAGNSGNGGANGNSGNGRGS